MADADKPPSTKAAEAAARVSDFRAASLKAAAKRRAERAVTRALASKETLNSGNSSTAAKPAAASSRPKAAPSKRANTWPSILQGRSSVKTRLSAQDSVDSAKAMAREGVRLRSEAAAERAREAGGVGSPRSPARSDSGLAPAGTLSSSAMSTVDAENGQDARRAATISDVSAAQVRFTWTCQRTRGTC